MLIRGTVASNGEWYHGIYYSKGEPIDFIDDGEVLGRLVAAGRITVGWSQRTTDDSKVDVGLVPQSIASGNVTGQYYSMINVDRAVLVCQFGPLATTGTVKVEGLQAQDAIGTGVAVIASANIITNATEITHVAACKQITLATFVAAATITITAYRKNNPTALYALTYTADPTTTTIATRTFSIAGIDTADAVELLKCLNDPTYGTPGLYWTSALGVVIGRAVDDAVTFTITCSVDDATDIRIQPQGQLIVEVDKNAFAAGFAWIAAKVTTTATVVCGVILIRHGSRFTPSVQQTDIMPVSVGL